MKSFATEFAVTPKTTAAFVAHVIQWLRGTEYSQVLESVSQEIEPDNFFAATLTGEQLRMREISTDELSAVGFRHDFPDGQGRNWRTEAVLLCRQNAGLGKLRLRTQCQAIAPGANLANPRKPYLIKSLLADGWGEVDGQVSVTDQPIYLRAGNEGLSVAQKLISGEGTDDLPVVYVSAIAEGSWALSKDLIERLAYRLGGVAHVVVEPNRAFSFDLKDRVRAQNAYGGSIGLYGPNLGHVSRYFIGWELRTQEQLMERVQNSAMALRTRMPSSGWDWSELQEVSLRQNRVASPDIEFEELERLYLEEIDALKDTISESKKSIEELNRAISDLEAELAQFNEDPLSNLQSAVGQQLYPGEIADRLRLAAKNALIHASESSLDERTVAVLKLFIDRIGRSSQGIAFTEQLKDCTSSNEKIQSSLVAFLQYHGFNKKSEKNHIRLEANDSLIGVSSITLPKTPSDHRAALNNRSQIMKLLGLKSLDF